MGPVRCAEVPEHGFGSPLPVVVMNSSMLDSLTSPTCGAAHLDQLWSATVGCAARIVKGAVRAAWSSRRRCSSRMWLADRPGSSAIATDGTVGPTSPAAISAPAPVATVSESFEPPREGWQRSRYPTPAAG